ncbi:transglutaminase domain-containing protein [Inhella sp.]|uniref:transglutaminase family protein n=1 Tax=Inhella sp. TaxID=1921806 RepID=UPI0035B1D91A
MTTTSRLHVRHDTHYAHPVPVELAQHVAFLRPRETEHQRLERWHLAIDPLPDGWRGEPNGVQQHLTQDAWGNERLVFGHSRVHRELSVCSEFVVALTPRPPIDPEAGPAWEQVAEQLHYSAGRVQAPEAEFSLASPYAAPDAHLAAFAREAFAPGLTLAAGALALNAQVHRRMRYEAQSTAVHTTAAEALRGGRGVCQDFAQIAIAACRSLGLAARYVSGYLLTEPPPGQPRLLGADASHAWFEVWCPTQGWLALDPTNDLAVNQQHALLAWGRDQADVAPLRGVIRGGGASEPEVAVTVMPA